jgi:hypothetical protein
MDKNSCLATNLKVSLNTSRPPLLFWQKGRQVSPFSNKVLLILELYSQAIVEYAEDEDKELAFGQEPDESDSIH